jgi:predicted pyridoxine 5'-phosphate oxidase superfamily flavin-nucleotide-binding protein
MKFHGGEISVQARAGVTDIAADVGEGIVDRIPVGAREFLALRRMVVVGSVDSFGHTWASVITGTPGFLSLIDDHTLSIGALPPQSDPLLENLRTERHIALFIPDFVAPRRIRLNGRGHIVDGAIQVHAEQVYGNCRRYMQERLLVGTRTSADPMRAHVTRASELSTLDRDQIQHTDTFFIATEHPEAGADVSHKGGNPGFVRVVDSRHLVFPDYNGNSMFNTLGNIAVNPKAGLLFIDFESGRTIQLTGSASIDWNPDRARDFVGAERVVDFTVEETIANEDGFPLIAKFRQYSRFNPA